MDEDEEDDLEEGDDGEEDGGDTLRRDGRVVGLDFLIREDLLVVSLESEDDDDGDVDERLLSIFLDGLFIFVM